MSNDDEVTSLSSSSFFSQPPLLSRVVQCSDASVMSARVLVLGDVCSGRTSVALAAAKAGTRLHLTSDYRSIFAGSCLTYLYRSSVARRKECLYVSVVDTGSVPRNSGVSHRFLPFCDTVVITFSLTGIKQNFKVSKSVFPFWGSSKGKSSNSTGLPVFVHDNDRTLLHDLLSMVGAHFAHSGEVPRIILIGTFKDLLTYGSPDDVEVLLKELRSICNDYLSLLQQRLFVSAVFAVNALQGSCISENRGGPNTLSGMWSFIYDLTLKDMMLRQPFISNSSQSFFNEFRWRSHSSMFSRLMYDSFSLPDEEVIEKLKSIQESKDGTGCNNSQVVSSVDPLLDCINIKIFKLIFRTKAERKIVFIKLNTLFRLMYSHGLQRKRYLRLTLQQLHNIGEIVLFRYHHESLASQDACICIHPHYINLAQGTIFLYSSYITNHSEKYRKLLTTGIDLQECLRCDPQNNVSRGIFSRSLLFKLASSLEIGRSSIEAADMLTMLLILSDTAFLRHCRRFSLTSKKSTSVSFSSSNEDIPIVHVSSYNLPDPSTSVISSENSLTISENPSMMHSATPMVREEGSVEYVIPSLIRMKCPREVIHCVRRLASSFSGTNREKNNYIISRILAIRACPPAFFPKLIIRLHRYIDISSPIFSQALWLSALTPSGEASPFLHIFIYHSSSDECIENSVDEREDYSGAVSFLEFYAFSNVGYLPLLLFLDDITRHVASLVRHEFPGMSTWATSGVKVNEKHSVGDSMYTGTMRGMEKLSEVNTMWDLDNFLHSLDW
ncbi:uncharacterized protein TM35_000081040 [Trypanosoma theileri]|uniref:Uncharacterized protein n=1 Tax=Trypanosoma theileri TaxID=67003 RepID=A0A1X0P031_9TRYP|nr:uncharacterized protein TM35_000081040 [Trypanosoma theileri]ORC90306.1 hypothetical protein TM35_000081040 [Trypanosoma theileri]